MHRYPDVLDDAYALDVRQRRGGIWGDGYAGADLPAAAEVLCALRAGAVLAMPPAPFSPAKFSAEMLRVLAFERRDRFPMFIPVPLNMPFPLQKPYRAGSLPALCCYLRFFAAVAPLVIFTGLPVRALL